MKKGFSQEVLTLNIIHIMTI